MPTFKEIKTRLLNIGAQDAGSDAEDMVAAAINNTYRRILSLKSADLRKREFSFSVASGTSQYGLPLYVRTDLNFDDASNTRSLIEMSSAEYDKFIPGSTDTGAPTHYYKIGKFGVQTQPENAGAITVVSDLTSDDGNRYVTVQGYDASGTLIREKVTLDGTTEVTTSASFTTVERVIKSVDSGYSITGNITVTDADDNVLSIIPSWVQSPSYLWVEFWPEPDATYTYTLRAVAYKPDLVNDDDWPEIDEDFHDLIEYGAGSDVLPTFGKESVAVLYADKFRERIREYKSYVDPTPNLIGVFENVQMGRYLPRSPWIPGVHRGLATGA